MDFSWQSKNGGVRNGSRIHNFGAQARTNETGRVFYHDDLADLVDWIQVNGHAGFPPVYCSSFCIFFFGAQHSTNSLRPADLPSCWVWIPSQANNTEKNLWSTNRFLGGPVPHFQGPTVVQLAAACSQETQLLARDRQALAEIPGTGWLANDGHETSRGSHVHPITITFITSITVPCLHTLLVYVCVILCIHTVI